MNLVSIVVVRTRETGGDRSLSFSLFFFADEIYGFSSFKFNFFFDNASLGNLFCYEVWSLLDSVFGFNVITQQTVWNWFVALTSKRSHMVVQANNDVLHRSPLSLTHLELLMSYDQALVLVNKQYHFIYFNLGRFSMNWTERKIEIKSCGSLSIFKPKNHVWWGMEQQIDSCDIVREHQTTHYTDLTPTDYNFFHNLDNFLIRKNYNFFLLKFG